MHPCEIIYNDGSCYYYLYHYHQSPLHLEGGKLCAGQIAQYKDTTLTPNHMLTTFLQRLLVGKRYLYSSINEGKQEGNIAACRFRGVYFIMLSSSDFFSSNL